MNKISFRNLQVEYFLDATVFPTSGTGGQLEGGAVNTSGKIIRQSLLYRNFSQVLFEPHEKINTGQHIDEPHLFAGPCFKHYGHFLLESLSRTWASAHFLDIPIVWTTPGPPTDWQQEICDLLGFGNRMHFVNAPTSFSQLLIPEPGYRIQDFFHPSHANFLAKYGAQTKKGHKPRVWMSRSRLPRGKAVVGEELVEDTLRTLGWTIVYPEAYSVLDQLDTLINSSVIAGVEGSALHSVAMLSYLSSPLIVVRRSNNFNFRTIANLREFIQYELIGSLYALKECGEMQFHSPKITALQIHKIADRHIYSEEGDKPSYNDLLKLVVFDSHNRLYAPYRRPKPQPRRNKILPRVRRYISLIDSYSKALRK